jgi:hypothetical protein
MPVSFNEAKKALDEGKRVSTKALLLAGEFIFKQVPSKIPSYVIPNMTSLPNSVKYFFIKKEVEFIEYKSQLAKVSNGNIIEGYQPSVSELEAEWFILNEDADGEVLE